MNIDFHYGVVYIIARVAGLSAGDAEIVAHACQYVDDSTVGGVLNFAGGQSYERFASSHEMLDYENTVDAQNEKIWLPFHFIPAGEGEVLHNQAICRCNSDVAQEMVQNALRFRNKDTDLHRLGITLHVYMDTWAHQGFSGLLSNLNSVADLACDNLPPNTLLETVFDSIRNKFLSTAADTLKLGHGAALHYPDIPWANWSYTDADGKRVERDNRPVFIEAANWIHRVIVTWMDGKYAFAKQPGLPDDVAKDLDALIAANTDIDESKRLSRLVQQVSEGGIGKLGREIVPTYIPKGPGSWKHKATGIADMIGDGDTPPVWSKTFEDSDYRKFHDALKEHRFDVMQTLLPKYGIRLA